MDNQEIMHAFIAAFQSIEKDVAESALGEVIDQHYDGDDDLLEQSLLAAYKMVAGNEWEV